MSVENPLVKILLRTVVILIIAMVLAAALNTHMMNVSICFSVIIAFFIIMMMTGDADVGDKRWLSVATSTGDADKHVGAMKRANIPHLNIGFSTGWILTIILLLVLSSILGNLL